MKKCLMLFLALATALSLAGFHGCGLCSQHADDSGGRHHGY